MIIMMITKQEKKIQVEIRRSYSFPKILAEFNSIFVVLKNVSLKFRSNFDAFDLVILKLAIHKIFCHTLFRKTHQFILL